jgi:isocitrate dehydrogenase
MKEYRISIKGPLTTPIGTGHKSINVMIRQKLDLFACVRPIKYFPGTSTPMLESGLTDMVVFRENTEDLYSGIEWEPNSEGAKRIIDFINKELGHSPFRFEENCGIGIKPVSEEGTKRLIRMAIDYSLALNKSSITIVHKGNIMKYTEGAFRDWAYDVVLNEYNGNIQKMVHILLKTLNLILKLLLKTVSQTISFNKLFLHLSNMMLSQLLTLMVITFLMH